MQKLRRSKVGPRMNWRSAFPALTGPGDLGGEEVATAVLSQMVMASRGLDTGVDEKLRASIGAKT